MFEAGAGCPDCHHNPQGRVIRSDAAKCLDCHEEDYRDVFTEWQNSYKEQKASISDSLKKLNSRNLSQQEKSELAEIRKILENIEMDGSKGIHNYQFIEEVMSTIQKKIKPIENEGKE